MAPSFLIRKLAQQKDTLPSLTMPITSPESIGLKIPPSFLIHKLETQRGRLRRLLMKDFYLRKLKPIT